MKMTNVAVALLLVLCVLQDRIEECQTQETESLSSSFIQKDITAELKCLKDLLNQQGTTLVELRAELMKMQTENTAQASELSALKSELENLTKTAETPKVAFTAGLGSPGKVRGPYNVETILVYKQVLTNIGGAYSPHTGIFRAPVRGIYYIRFTASVYDNESNNIGLNLYKNGQYLMHLGENKSDGRAKHLTSGVTMELNEGDEVYTHLPAHYVVWGGNDLRTTFSGFLISTM